MKGGGTDKRRWTALGEFKEWRGRKDERAAERMGEMMGRGSVAVREKLRMRLVR